MQYYSTNHQSSPVDFQHAVLKGLAPDKGLYMPEQIPPLSESFLKNITEYSTEEIAYEVMHPYVKGIIPAPELVRIIMETISFKIPLVKVSRDISSLELFHGPTLTFKDLGARFMALCFEYFLTQINDKPVLLLATSGDSGGAIANSFFNIEGLDVVILYPSGKVNLIQEKQLTTWGKNIHPVEVTGSFEDCNQMVNDIFNDEEINNKIFLASASSANIARWLPQQLFYFFAYKQWADKDNPPVISVPVGNLGNLSAGLLGCLSGLPVQHFIAACNANDTILEFLKTEKYQPKKTVETISHAMDVGDPINFIRIMELFNHQPGDIKKWISSYSVSDKDTRATIKSIHHKNDYLLDPHGAVAYAALQQYLLQHPDQKGIIFKPAHAAKFFDIVEPIIEEPTPMPSSIELELIKEKSSYKINADVNVLKYFLLTI
jgi:threonine synthase